MKKPKEVAFLLLMTGVITPVFPAYMPALLVGLVFISLKILVSDLSLAASKEVHKANVPSLFIEHKWNTV